MNWMYLFFLMFGVAAVLFLRWAFGKEAGELWETLDHPEKPKHPDGIWFWVRR